MEKRAGRDVRRLPAVVMIVSLLAGSIAATHSQTPVGQCEYFTETRHYVCTEFLEFFWARGGPDVFGYPLTEAFDDPTRGLRVQYFQRARMEWHPYNSAPYTVQLGLLIDELGYIYSPIEEDKRPAFNSTVHHFFPETGHSVSYAFLTYFREKGGVDIFGYPRSEFMYEEGYIVQYFQRARMEWHPEAASGSQMSLTNIGEIYIERFGVPAGVDEPVSPPIGEEDDPNKTPEPLVTKLDASASVRYVIMGRQGTQTVFVYITDQSREPVQNATVRTIVHYQSGDQTHTCDATNASGFAKCSFDIQLSPPGEKVVIDVMVDYGELTATTQTFFLPWW